MDALAPTAMSFHAQEGRQCSLSSAPVERRCDTVRNANGLTSTATPELHTPNLSDTKTRETTRKHTRFQVPATFDPNFQIKEFLYLCGL